MLKEQLKEVERRIQAACDRACLLYTLTLPTNREV